MEGQNVEQVIILVTMLCIIIGTIAAIIRMAIKRTVEKNILTYIALRASALILQGRVLLWDDLMQLYEIDIKSLLGTSGTLTYEEGQYTLILVKKFLTRYAPPESDEWQKSLQKARRSIPSGGTRSTRRPMCIPSESADSNFMGCLLLIGIAGLVGFTAASTSPSWLIVLLVIIPVVLTQLFLIITTVRMLRWAALLAQATKERKKSIFHSLVVVHEVSPREQPQEREQDRDPEGLSERDAFLQAANKTYVPSSFYTILSLTFYGILLIKYEQTTQILRLNSAQFLWVLLWVAVIAFLVTIWWGGICRLSISSLLFRIYTGIRYRENHMAYARAGGYDIWHAAPLLAVTGTFGVYWWTSTIHPDPLASVRNIWIYIAVAALVTLLLNLIIGSLAFGFYAQHRGISSSPVFSFRFIRITNYDIWGTILALVGRYDRAISAYQKALRIDPNHIPTHNNLAGTYYGMGGSLFRQNRFEDALLACRESIRLNPSSAPAYNSLGICLYVLQRYDEAVAAYQEILHHDHNSAPAYNNLGEVLVDLQRYDEAIAACQEALRINPRLAEPHHHIGRAYRGLGCWDDAVHEWEEALRIDPHFSPALQSLPEARRHLQN